MNEARRFLRYLFPGIVFVTEFVLYLVFSDPTKLTSAFTSIPKDNIGAIGATIIVTGGLGYLLSMLHHLCYSIWGIQWVLYGRDYRRHVQLMVSRGLLRLQHATNGTEVGADQVTEDGAWRICTTLWNTRTKESKFFEAANDRVNAMADIAHGAGASLMGALSAFACAVLVMMPETLPRPMCLLGTVLLIIHLLGTLMAMMHFHGVVKQSIILGLKAELKEPIALSVDREDLVPVWRYMILRFSPAENGLLPSAKREATGTESTGTTVTARR